MASEKTVRVLVVDDEPEVCDLVTTLLKNVGIETLRAHNAAEAAQILRTPPLPNLVILDLMLPDVSGLEFLRQIRAKEVFDELPVLILSALADADQIRAGLSTGADRYLTKPYMANNLVGYVQEMLRTGRRRDHT